MSTKRDHCLACDPERRKSKSLAITTDERGTVEYCHRCQYVRAENSPGNIYHGKSLPVPVALSHAKPDLATIWARTQPLRGTIGETYLKHRRCALPPSDSDLRFLPERINADRGYLSPSLCALVTDAVTAEPMTLHFTRLRDDGLGKAGTDRDKLLLRGHPKAGGVIRLWPDSDVRYGLGVAEGVETALSAAHAYTPVWATVDAGNMAKLPVLDCIETLLIFADNDAAGLAAARACGSRWAAAGREARLVVPDHGDVNDAVAA